MGGPTVRTAYLTDAEKAYWPDDPTAELPDRLPQVALLAMAARGEVIETVGWPDFMCADVHWIEPEEYGEAFEALCAQVEEVCAEPAPRTVVHRAEDTMQRDLEQLSWPAVGMLALGCAAGLIWLVTH